MGRIVIAPVQWSSLKDIDDTRPVGEADFECLRDIREVLKRHGALDRFGVALLHSHFNLNSDEVWLEECDEENRILVTRPVRETDAGEGNVGTIWHLRDDDIHAGRWCRKYCMRGGGLFFGHSREHTKVNR